VGTDIALLARGSSDLAQRFTGGAQGGGTADGSY
jgi:hypothetical protein